MESINDGTCSTLKSAFDSSFSDVSFDRYAGIIRSGHNYYSKKKIAMALDYMQNRKESMRILDEPSFGFYDIASSSIDMIWEDIKAAPYGA